MLKTKYPNFGNVQYLYYFKIVINCIVFSGILFHSTISLSQTSLSFGNITADDLKNKPYTPDPGADAIVLSDIAIAGLGYDDRDFFVEMERDIKIRIVNSNGFDYANIVIPFRKDEKITNYKASTFNIKNGEKVETPILKNEFVIEKTGESLSSLKFSFPDVHEGSIIEFTYRMRLGRYSKYILVPWKFQWEIPVALSSLTIEYPESFVYKYVLSGNLNNIRSESAMRNKRFLNDYVQTNILRWTANDVPAFKDEPYIIGRNDLVSKITFELAKVEFPDFSKQEITPSYNNLTEELMKRSDFGTPLETNLKSLTKTIIGNEKDNRKKLLLIHRYITSNILWNGEKDFTTSAPLRTILQKEKGNSADINILLIAMARAAGLSAEPVVFSTRSNGSFNVLSALITQYNYVVARINIEGEYYLVDATNPLSPFNELPFDCLNTTGWLCGKVKSDFVELTNKETNSLYQSITMFPEKDGTIVGEIENTYKGYLASDLRKQIRLESEEGYYDLVKSNNPEAQISEYKLGGVKDVDSEAKESYNFKIIKGSHLTQNELIIKPYQLNTAVYNPFYMSERKFPVDFGCPQLESFTMSLTIPEGYSLDMKPENASFTLGKDGGSFKFTCEQTGNIINISSLFKIDKIAYAVSEYKDIQNFYLKVQQKQSEYIVLKKN